MSYNLAVFLFCEIGSKLLLKKRVIDFVGGSLNKVPEWTADARDHHWIC